MIRSTIFAAMMLAALPAFAQDAPSPDEFLALNIYLQRNETAAVEAELRRLRLKYPQWTPPADLRQLSNSAPSGEIDTFYKQIAAGQIEQARGTLAAMRRDYPNWTPPADMTTQLETASGQQTLDSALDGGDVDAARSVAARTPGLLRCDRINNAWRIADGQRSAGRSAEALATYRAILGACVNPADLTATIEKADAVSSSTELRAMVAQVSGRFPAEAARFDELLQRLLAGRGSGAAAPAVAQPRTEQPAPRQQAATPRAEPQQQAQPQRQQQTRSPDAGRAEAVAPRRSNESPAQCAARTANARAAGTVLERAWCVYNLNRTMDAMADFRTALSGRLTAKQQREAQYGLALSYLKLGMAEEASRIAAKTDFTRQQRVDVERQILDQRGVQAYRERRFRDAVRYFDALEQVTGGIRRDLAILRAYAYLNAGQRPKAHAEFLRLNNELSTTETRKGLAAAASE
ncbi:hypothetical protein [Paracoccus sp. PAR01]|uniref:hypothetical protein n=1 Tax=Paracoccus sp. PAR01 TaxID=2769282 RepID=UPI00177FC683|nr:hypothetical protein [Paracoccus sp. PAR01]MBD9527597.1 hypothetical protein [Paracoccus sp. PAR01]